MSKKYIPLYLIFFAWSVYTFLSLYAILSNPTPPSSPITLSLVARSLLQASISIVYLAVWLAATFSIGELRKHARNTHDEVLQKGFRLTANGILSLLLGLVLTTLLGLVRQLYPLQINSALGALTTISTNYLHMLFPLFGFLFIFFGAITLTKPNKKRLLEDGIISAIVVAVIGALYILLIFTNTVRQASPGALAQSSYFLPDMLIVSTIILPVLVSWFSGIWGALLLSKWHYSPPQRSAVGTLVNGFLFVIFSTIMLQALLSIGSARLLELGLIGILTVVYLFLLVLLIGYVLIAFATRRLRPDPGPPPSISSNLPTP